LYTVYHRRRLSSTFELFVYQPLSTAARDKPEFARGLRALGKSGRQQMRLAFVEYGGTGWLPGKWPTSMADPIYDRTTWAWGLFPVEFGAKVLLDLLRMTQKLIDVSDPPSPIEPIKRDHTSSRIWTDVDCKRFDDAASSLDPYSDAGKLSRFWTRGYREIDALEKRRALEQANNWRPGTEGLLQTLCRYANHELDLTRWDDELTCNYFPAMFAFLCDPPRTRFCAKRAYGIARIIRRVALFALAKAERALTNADLRVLEKDLAQRLRDLAQRFVVAAQVPDPPRGILRTLMQLEVIEFAFNDHEKLNNDTSIELVQISGNGDSPLGSKSNAKDKLLGLQLAHFGAFYKKSWRANDWLYGRLTGAENLVKVLLNPERLHRRFYTRRADAFTHIRDIALDSVPSTRLHTKLAEIWASEGYAVLINKELEFLDNANYALPDSLPYAARSITTRLHFGILAEELPELLGAIHQDQADGASFSGAGEAMLRDLGDDTRKALDDRLTTSAPDDNRRFNEIQISPEQAQLWLQRGLLAGETLREQAGSDMFTRTLAHTAATLQGTIASKAAHLGPISALFAAIKMPILGFYFVTRGLLGQSRTTAALNGGVLALGLALVLLQFFWTPDDLLVDMIPRSLVVFGWALLAYGSIVCMLRQPWTTILLAVVTLTLLAVYAHSYEHGGVAIAVAGFMLLIAFSVRVPPLQWLVGVVAIVFAAMWGSGWLASGLSAAPPNVDVLVFAAALLIALMLAVLQSSHIPVRIRAFTKRAWSMRSRTRIERFAFGMYLTVQMGYFRRARIASIDVADVRELTPAARRGLMQDDRIVAIDGHATQGMTIADFNRSIEPPHRPRQIRVLRTTSDGDRQQIDVTLP
jgi:hypothetical protein